MIAERRFGTFSPQEIESLRPAMKIGLLATINNEGQPHLTLLSSLQAVSPTRLAFGQFMEGLSKSFARRNPRTGFLVMTLRRELWRGRADFTGTAKAGPELEEYNQVPMFRYNAYFGIHTVYSFNLREHGGKESLPMARVIAASLATSAARFLAGPGQKGAAINPWTRGLLNGMGNLKFAAYVGADGYPWIVPVIQAQAAADRVIFSIGAYGDEISAIPAGAPVAVFGMTLSMEDILLRGTFRGVRRLGLFRCGIVDVDWAYNPMPPVPGQVYPPRELAPVRDFEGRQA